MNSKFSQLIKPHQHKHFYSMLILTGLIFFIYSPGLTNYMVADDIPNIINNPGTYIDELDTINISAALTSNDSGPLKRPIASLSFGLNYYFSGKAIIPSHFKATNVAIHIINSFIVYFLALLLLKTYNNTRGKSLPTYKLAIFIAMAWAFHPLQLTAVLYIVQRMTSMSAFFMLSGFLVYMLGRQKLNKDKPYALIQMYSGVILGTLLGALCKENALLLPYFIAVTELTLLSNVAPISSVTLKEKLAQRKITTLITITAVLPAVIVIGYLITHPNFILNGYVARNFTLTERLLTEARILFQYMQLIFYPNIRQMTLYHDTILISKSLFIPWTTLPAIAGIILSITLSIIFRKKYPVAAFAILWFLVAHAMESTIFSLALMYEHRNYLAIFGLAFATAYYAYLLLERLTNKSMLHLTAGIAIIFSLTLATLTRAEIWSYPGPLTFFDVKYNPDSSKAHGMRAKYLLESGGAPMDAYEHLRKTSTLELSDTVSLIAMHAILSSSIIKLENNILDEQETNAMPVSFNSQPRLNIRHISHLSTLIDTELKSRLRTNASPIEATMSLSSATSCATKKQVPGCIRILEDVINWLNIALNNSRFPSKERAGLHVTLSYIYRHQGDSNRMLDHIDLAYAEYPKDLYILIEKVKFLIGLNKLEEARLIITKVEKNNLTLPNHLKELQKIKSTLDELRKKEP